MRVGTGKGRSLRDACKSLYDYVVDKGRGLWEPVN